MFNTTQKPCSCIGSIHFYSGGWDFSSQLGCAYQGGPVLDLRFQRAPQHQPGPCSRLIWGDSQIVLNIQWIGLRENLQETIDVPIKYGGFPVNFPLNQSVLNMDHLQVLPPVH